MNQSARYYTLPPEEVPAFIYKHYPNALVRHAQDLIAWSKKEYNDALRLYARRGEFATVRLLTTNYSPMRLLAEMDGFRRIVALLVRDADIFNSLSGRDRVFIRRAYEVYEMLRKEKLVQ